MFGQSATFPDSPSVTAVTLRLLLLSTLVLLLLFPSGCARRDSRSIPSPGPMDEASAREALHRFYLDWQKVPYRAGGMTKHAVDCSGLAVLAYREIFGISLPRTSREQADFGRTIHTGPFKPGDLLFFRTGSFQHHIGLYFKDNTFIHASSSRGVTLSRLDDPYWQQSFRKASRAFEYTRTASR